MTDPASSSASSPLVSVIIPTTRRHDLVRRAIRSVLSQTMQEFEIVVVVDGPNPDTERTLSGIADPRLRIVVNAVPLGAGGARNRGAALARGAWVAFLDDDDEYLPAMLARCLAAAGGRSVMLCCRCRVLGAGPTVEWPRALYRTGTPVDDYLFDRRTLFRGDRHIQTSSFVLPRAVFLLTQFGTTSHNEDRTLLLRVTKQERVPLEMVPETLLLVHAVADSLGPNYEVRAMLGWAEASRTLLTRRAYSGFCLVYLGSQAARRRDWRAVPLLLRHAFRHGAPRPMHLAAFAAFWLVPSGLRQRLRGRVQGTSSTGSASDPPGTAAEWARQARS